MNDAKYIGLDVHQATISAAVLDSAGKLVMEAILETKAETILQFLRGLRGSLHVTLEEGTWGAWLHDLLKPHVTRVLVSDPRKNDLGRDGSRNDRRDARELAELLYRDKVKSVYHGEHGLRTLKELARSYLTITRDLTRVMTRIKAIYRSWAIPCAGQQVYALGHRAEWLAKLSEAGVRRRAEFYYQQFDTLAPLRQVARCEFHQGCDVTVPRAAQEIALPVTQNGTVLHFRGPFADRDGLRNLTASVFKDMRVLRPAYAALGSQVVQQLLFQRPTGLNEQASVNGFVGHTHAHIIGILGFPPAGNLLRRPVQNQFTRNEVPQLQVEGKKAALGPQGRLPGFSVGLIGSIRRAATMTCDLPAHSRYRSL
jgi:hypothetical protein